MLKPGTARRTVAAVMTGAAVLLLLSSCGTAVHRQPNAGNVPNGANMQGTNAVQPLATDGTNAATSTARRKNAQSDKHLHRQFLDRVHQAARQGRMVNAADFVVGKTLIDEVHRQWGKPNRSEGGYDYYYPGMMKGSIAFGVGRGDIIKEIRIADTALDPVKDGIKVKVSEVKSALGKPDSVRRVGRQKRLIYTLGEYKLLFDYNPTASQNPELESISVFSPKAAKPMGAGR
ncbi:YjgB family protein [Paenibacillus kobensis]|uniref:YjgB family protein n=1 Tax=Paenibacillus kobensis TaxID=59841 RepID=UPI000FDACC97|nr:YjgB family protein [Paenibacillus kobensis]